MTSGRVSDPTSRITVAGPDDHWSQYVIQLDAQQARGLQDDSRGGTVPAEEVSATLVPTMEEIAGTCRADWMDVTDGLATG